MKPLMELDAYVNRELDDAAADAFEERMFAAPDDADLALIDRIQHHGAKLAEHGTFDMGVTREHVDDLIRAGHKVQVLDAGPPGAPVKELLFARDAEMIVTALPLGRTDLERVDVEISVLDHNVTRTIKDVLVDQADGVIYGLCERALALLSLAAGPTLTRVRYTTGDRDVIAEWNLHGHLA